MESDFANIWTIIKNILDSPIQIWGFNFTWGSVLIWVLLASLILSVIALLYKN